MGVSRTENAEEESMAARSLPSIIGGGQGGAKERCGG